MTKLLDDALAAVHGLPLDEQDSIARAVLRLAGQDDEPPVALSAEERAAVAASKAAAARGEVRADVEEVHAWAVMGMNVFLGLRYGVWEEDRGADEIAGVVADFLRRGLAP